MRGRRRLGVCEWNAVSHLCVCLARCPSDVSRAHRAPDPGVYVTSVCAGLNASVGATPSPCGRK